MSNRHVIDTKKSLLSGIISKGPLGEELNLNFENRNNKKVLDDIGLVLLNLAKFVPNGILVVFNSSG